MTELSEAIDDASNAKELQALFDLRWKADRRATARWQSAHPGNDLTWPDHADMVVWLMEHLDEIRALIRETLPYLETAASRSSDLERDRVPSEIADDIRKWLTGGTPMRSPADLVRELTKIADAIDAADRHFRAQGEADAALHMAPTVRYNPLSVAVATAKDDIHRVIAELETE